MPKNIHPGWLIGGIAAGVVILGLAIAGSVQKEYYTDGYGIRQDVEGARVRQVLWEPAEPLQGFERLAEEMFDPAFGSDGSTLILNKGRPGKKGGADLHFTENPTGDGWKEPAPMDSINSIDNDFGAHLSADGRHLVFSSDRDGGFGGYDIWYSQLNGEGEWDAPVNAGAEVNTAFNEYNPAYDPYLDTLYFSSNRPDRELTEEEKNAWIATNRELLYDEDYDIFSTQRIPAPEPQGESGLPAPPVAEEKPALFFKAKRVDGLNTEADESQVTLTPRGDFLYFTSNREGGFGGFDIYRARLHNGQFKEIDNIGAPVNTPDHEMDPALTNHGYILVFSSNRPSLAPPKPEPDPGTESPEGDANPETAGQPAPEAAPEPNVPSTRFTLYQSTSREVFIQVEPSLLSSILNAIWENIWWILLALAILALILYLHYLLRRKDMDLGMTTKCLLGSLLAHALLAFLLSLWFITYKIIEDAADPLMEAQLDTDTLAQEQLALEIRETITDMVPAVEEPIPVQAVRPDMPIPTIEPIESPDIAPPPDAFVIEQQPVRFTPPIPENTPQPDPAPTLPPPEIQPIDTIQPFAASPVPFQMESVRELAAPSAEPVLQSAQTTQNLTPTQSATVPQDSPETPTLTASTQAVLESAPVAQAELPPLTAPILPNNFELPTQDSPQLPELAENPTPTVQLDATRDIQAEAQPELQQAEANQTLTQNTPVENPAPIAPAPAPAFETPQTQESLEAQPSNLTADAPTPSEPVQVHPDLPSQPTPELPQPLQPVAMQLSLDATRTVEAQANPELQEAQAEQSLAKALLDTPDSPPSPTQSPSLDIPLVEEGILAKEHANLTPDTPAPSSPVPVEAQLPDQPAPEIPQPLQPANLEVALDTQRDVQAQENPELREAQPSSQDTTQVTTTGNPSQPSPEQTSLDAPETEPTDLAQTPSTLQATTPEQSTPDQPAPELPSNPTPEIPEPLQPTSVQLALESTRNIENQEQAQLQEAEADSPSTQKVAIAGDPSQPSPEQTNLDAPDTEPTELAQTPSTLQATTPDQANPDQPAPELPSQPAVQLPELNQLSPLQLELDSARTLLAENRPILQDATDGQTTTKATLPATPDLPAPELPPLQLIPLPELPSQDTPQTVLNTDLPTLETPGLPALAGPDSTIAAHLPTIEHDPRLLLETRPAEEEPYLLRDPQMREKVLDRLGGNEDTEKAVARALDWFSRNQEPDGRWDIQKHGGQRGHDNASTSFAVLCYLGWGVKHNEPGKYQNNINKALDWLISKQEEDGGFTNRQHNGMYDHGIASVALAEAYGLTQDPKLREPLEKAIDFIIKAQNQNHGAWDYRPNSTRIDTSVSGWQIMALRSARLAGLELPDRPFELSAKWLDSIGAGQHRGIYGYDRRSYKTHAMVATGLFAQQLLGLSPEERRMKESVQHIAQNMPRKHSRDFYYWYYACLALYQNQGPAWEEWNAKMKPVWLDLQEEHGQHAGSWAPSGGNHMGDMGRVITTALATLSLEVYYRYLPLYQTRAVTLTMQE